MGRAIDVTGQTFGDWTVIERDNNKKTTSGNIYWICQCSCGEIRSVDGSRLRTGKTKSCGKCKKNYHILKQKRDVRNLEGYIFGNWTVIEKIKTSRKNTAYKCKCVCGNEKTVEARHLKDGTSTSCGCMKQATIKNLTGQSFGDLTVIERCGSNIYGNAMWRCKCSCGRECIRNSKHLLSFSSTSCGCRRSSGESIIGSILREHNIKYETEYIFQDLKGEYNALRFDFAIFNDENLKCLIEYQGQQHYKISFGLNNSDLEKQKNYDVKKQQYCIKHNIPLIIIPYTDKNKLSWQYLDTLIKKYI